MKRVNVEVSERCARLLEVLQQVTGLSEDEVIAQALFEFLDRRELGEEFKQMLLELLEKSRAQK
ncbi:MAG: hypothetical protein QXL64_06040 [Thermofilaceae archaeon]